MTRKSGVARKSIHGKGYKEGRQRRRQLSYVSITRVRFKGSGKLHSQPFPSDNGLGSPS